MEIKWGLVPDMAGTPILASLVRDDILRDLTYTGRIFSAQEAMSYGLVGVKQGDSVCMLMRNDIAFIEAAYAAMRLGAYGVPVNWHFKPEEINYVLKDSGTAVLIAHADMLHQLREAIPEGVTALSVPTPPEILANYKINPDHLATPDFAIDFESWLQAAPAL